MYAGTRGYPSTRPNVPGVTTVKVFFSKVEGSGATSSRQCKQQIATTWVRLWGMCSRCFWERGYIVENSLKGIRC